MHLQHSTCLERMVFFTGVTNAVNRAVTRMKNEEGMRKTGLRRRVSTWEAWRGDSGIVTRVSLTPWVRRLVLGCFEV